MHRYRKPRTLHFDETQQLSSRRNPTVNCWMKRPTPRHPAASIPTKSRSLHPTERSRAPRGNACGDETQQLAARRHPAARMPDETHQRAARRNSSRRSPISSIPTESSSAHPEYTQQPKSRRNPPVHCLAKLSRRDPAARIVTKSNNRSPDQTQQLTP